MYQPGIRGETMSPIGTEVVKQVKGKQGMREWKPVKSLKQTVAL